MSHPHALPDRRGRYRVLVTPNLPAGIRYLYQLPEDERLNTRIVTRPEQVQGLLVSHVTVYAAGYRSPLIGRAFHEAADLAEKRKAFTDALYPAESKEGEPKS